MSEHSKIDIHAEISRITTDVKLQMMTPPEATAELLDLFSQRAPQPLTFEMCLREEFLINTQNYPKSYHDVFRDKYQRARRAFEEQKI